MKPSETITKIQEAMQKASLIRPKVGGFPYLAEALRQAGVLKNIWTLPTAQSLFITKTGTALFPNQALVTEATEVVNFDEEALIKVLRADQAGESSFAEFLQGSWLAGVTGYEVDFEQRQVTYYGYKQGQKASYIEEYPQVSIEE